MSEERKERKEQVQGKYRIIFILTRNCIDNLSDVIERASGKLNKANGSYPETMREENTIALANIAERLTHDTIDFVELVDKIEKEAEEHELQELYNDDRERHVSYYD